MQPAPIVDPAQGINPTPTPDLAQVANDPFASPPPSPYKKWPSVLATILLIVSMLAGTAVGPLMIASIFILGDMAWIIAMFFFAYIVLFASITLILILVLTIVAILSAKKHAKPKKIYMASSAIVAIATTLSVFRLISSTMNIWVFGSCMTACVLYSFFVLIKFKNKKNQPNDLPISTVSTAKPAFKIILMVLAVLNIGALGYTTVPTLLYQIQMYQQIKEWQNQIQSEQDDIRNNSSYQVGDQLADMVYSICNGSYDIVYAPAQFKNQGVFECKDNNYMYYVRDTNKKSGYYTGGEMYQIGQTYHELIEEFFPGGIYLYRESFISDVPNELKIAFEVKDEDELLREYGPKLFLLFKKMNETYEEELLLNVYFNKTLEGIESSYDRLFLMAYSYPHNTDAANGYGKYTFDVGDPGDLFGNIFGNPDSYPTNARNAVKFNRNINAHVTDGRTITQNAFMQLMKNSFDDTF